MNNEWKEWSMLKESRNLSWRDIKIKNNKSKNICLRQIAGDCFDGKSLQAEKRFDFFPNLLLLSQHEKQHWSPEGSTRFKPAPNTYIRLKIKTRSSST